MMRAINDCYDIVHPWIQDEFGPHAAKAMLATGVLTIFLKFGLPAIQSIAFHSPAPLPPTEFGDLNAASSPTTPSLLVLISLAGLAAGLAKCRSH